MSTRYRASIRVDGDTLHVSRPLLAPERVADLIGQLEYGFTSGDAAGIVAVELFVSTADDSGTPIGDGIATTTSTPLTDDDDEVTP